MPALEVTMFSGIVETTSSIRAAQSGPGVVQIRLERPKSFKDLSAGDSIAVNGICLTLEEFDLENMQFALAPETLKVTGWTLESVLGKVVNLERSLRLQDRVHGHLVTGHVDAIGFISHIERQGDTQKMNIQFPESLKPFIWSKGSIAINGVALTINELQDRTLSVWLIPETLKRTNLGMLVHEDKVNLEIDNMARGLVHWARVQQESL